MMTAFRALIRKDLALYFVDRRAVLMTIVAPIVIASFFGYLFGGRGGQTETSRISVLAVNQDGSVISKDLASRMAGDKALDVKPATAQEARMAVRKGQAAVAVVIPPGFGEAAGRAFFNGQDKPRISLLYDPSHAAEMSMVQGILAGHVMESVSKEMFTGQMGRKAVKEFLPQIERDTALPKDERKTLTDLLRSVEQWNAQNDSRAAAGQAGFSQGLTLPYSLGTEAVTSGAGIQYNGYAHSFGGMGIQFILFLGIDVGVGLLLQRQRGLWKRLRAAPLSRGLLLASRGVSAGLISMFIMLVMFGFARVVFGVRIQGSMAGFLGVCAAFSLMTASFGLLIAALGKTPDATRGLAILVTLLMVMLGGSWAPTFIFPQWLQTLTLAVPTRWAMDGLDATTWRGLGFSSAVGPIAVLTGCALAFGALAVVRFRWEADG